MIRFQIKTYLVNFDHNFFQYRRFPKRLKIEKYCSVKGTRDEKKIKSPTNGSRESDRGLGWDTFANNPPPLPSCS